MTSLVVRSASFALVATSSKRRSRQRGAIEELPSGALRVRVYAGMDPVSKKRIYLSEIVSAGPKAGREAERVRSRLQNQVDERRNPRTRATLSQLIDRWLEVLDVDASTRRTYEGYIRKHVRPLLGSLSLTRLDVETLDSFYAELRRCREHCDRRGLGQHRASLGERHSCRGLADSTVRQIHWIISGALDRAVVWQWDRCQPGRASQQAAASSCRP